MRYLYIFFILAMAAAGCSGGRSNDDAAVPRRHAYPRIELPDSSFTFIEIDGKGMQLPLNDAADYAFRTSDDGVSGFIDVEYPGLNAAIYYTVTPVTESSVAEVIDNRLERIRLNLGGSDAELLEFDSPAGFENKIFVSRANISTPVQFIATDGKATVISGMAFLKDASAANADSLSPVAAMLRRDIIHSLKMLQQ